MTDDAIIKFDIFLKGFELIEQGKTGSLNAYEKRIAKYLMEQNWSVQDIQALVNKERLKTINSGRISPVRKDVEVVPASELEFNDYIKFKSSFDQKTGLNSFLDESLIKSREAMKLAVQTFNSPLMIFRAETFSTFAVVAWTYLALEYSLRNQMPTERNNGKAISLADFLKERKCPFSEGIKNNLKAMIKLRDLVQHRVLGPFEEKWVGIFQANCVNYEKTIVSFFGQRLSLSGEMSFALQFSGLSIDQATALIKSDLPPVIKSINRELFDGMTDEQTNDMEFQFFVTYTKVVASNAKSAFHFYSPESAEGIEKKDVVVKLKTSAITHPHKPTNVIKEVSRRIGKRFTISNHTQAYQRHKVRPGGNNNKPEVTNEDFCYYDKVYKGYSYNDAWIELLIKEVEAQHP
jgi:hypothetical protein